MEIECCQIIFHETWMTMEGGNMKFDFETNLNRHGMDSIAVDAVGKMPGFAPDAPQEGFDVIPMWVADMNFPTCPSIPEALITRAKHPAYGYFVPTEEYYNAIIRWHKLRKGVEDIEKKHIGYENGVLGGVVTACKAFADPGDAVFVPSPTYIGYTRAVGGTGFRLIHSDLVRDENGIYRMNYEEIDTLLQKNHCHVAILCSPDNPSGRVWEREELERIMEIYRKNQVVVISDEIWSDLVMPGHRHIPTQSISEDARNRTIAIYAPSKTFNLAGLIGSYHIIYNSFLRDRVRSKAMKTHYNEMNVMSEHALIGAYSKMGMEWTDQLNEQISRNLDYAVEYFQTRVKGIRAKKPDGTYMLFVDCREYCEDNHITLQELERKIWSVGVTWQDGTMFRDPYALRINTASPFERVKEAFERVDRYVFHPESQ